MRVQLPFIAFSIVLVAALYFLFDLPLGYTALGVFVGWPLIGTLITADDDLPGGFSNPDGSVKRPWLTLEYWGQVAFRAALGALAFAIEFMSIGSSFTTPLVCTVFLAALGWVLVSVPSNKRPASG